MYVHIVLLIIYTAGHIGGDSSLFQYFDGKTHSDYNDGWDTHSPSFEDELEIDTPSPEAVDICNDDMQCIFDYVVTNSMVFATGTHTATIENQETQDILGKFLVYIHVPFSYLVLCLEVGP